MDLKFLLWFIWPAVGGIVGVGLSLVLLLVSLVWPAAYPFSPWPPFAGIVLGLFAAAVAVSRR